MSLRKSNFIGASPAYTGVRAGSSVAVTSIHPCALSSRVPGSRGEHPTTRLSNTVKPKRTVMSKNSFMQWSQILYHGGIRSEEHTSELQSLAYLVCRLLLEKKKKKIENHITTNSTRKT